MCKNCVINPAPPYSAAAAADNQRPPWGCYVSYARDETGVFAAGLRTALAGSGAKCWLDVDMDARDFDAMDRGVQHSDKMGRVVPGDTRVCDGSVAAGGREGGENKAASKWVVTFHDGSSTQEEIITPACAFSHTHTHTQTHTHTHVSFVFFFQRPFLYKHTHTHTHTPHFFFFCL